MSVEGLGIDVSPLGLLCAAMMEQIAERYGDDAILRTSLVVVEVENAEASRILVASDEPRPWVQLAFLGEGRIAVEDRLASLEGLEED